MNHVKAAVFASGSGTNFQSIIEASDLCCDIELLVCDNPDAGVIDKARELDVPVFIATRGDYTSKADYEQVLTAKLREKNVSWIFLAGYMRLVGETLLNAYAGRIINIHPSMLPAFPGKHAIEQAFEAGIRTTGVTIHYVDAGIDTGTIIAQESVEISQHDTMETLTQRIQQVEHRLYPRVINQLIGQAD